MFALWRGGGTAGDAIASYSVKLLLDEFEGDGIRPLDLDNQHLCPDEGFW